MNFFGAYTQPEKGTNYIGPRASEEFVFCEKNELNIWENEKNMYIKPNILITHSFAWTEEKSLLNKF